MDWTTPLLSQQADFIKRLKSGCLLHCEIEGQHSELKIISGEKLRQLREFCWLMAERHKRTSLVREVFINNLRGKLAEEVVKARLADFVTEVDYKQRIDGNSKVDSRLSSESRIGIQVKACHGSVDMRWSISLEEVERNKILVCILIQEEVSEAQAEYHLILAGFLPTNVIKMSKGEASIGIDELLYSGGLLSYLESIKSLESDYLFLVPKITQDEQTPTQSMPIPFEDPSRAYAYLSLGVERYKEGNYERAIKEFDRAIRLNSQIAVAYNWRGNSRNAIGDNQGAIEDYNQALRLISEDTAEFYKNRGNARSAIGDNRGAIEDYNQAIAINPNYADAYFARGSARSAIGDEQAALEDCEQALKINPNYADAYFARGSVRSAIGDMQGALEDCDRALKINPNYAEAYYGRGVIRFTIKDVPGAIEDCDRAIRINPNYAEAYNNRSRARSAIGDEQGALEDLQKALDLVRQDNQTYYPGPLHKIFRKL